MTAPSHDQELLAQLKQRLMKPGHNWREEYDQKGRLLRLHLDHLGLVQFPPEPGQLSSLQELDLDNNQLSALPPEIVQQGAQAMLAYIRTLQS